MVCIVMYSHGPPSFKRLDFNSVRLIMTVNMTYMMCIAAMHYIPNTGLLTVLSVSPQLVT